MARGTLKSDDFRFAAMNVEPLQTNSALTALAALERWIAFTQQELMDVRQDLTAFSQEFHQARIISQQQIDVLTRQLREVQQETKDLCQMLQDISLATRTRQTSTSSVKHHKGCQMHKTLILAIAEHKMSIERTNNNNVRSTSFDVFRPVWFSNICVRLGPWMWQTRPSCLVASVKSRHAPPFFP